MASEARRSALAPRVWGEFAEDVTSYTGPDVARILRGAGWPAGIPWRLVWTAGYFQAGMPMLFEAIGPHALPGTYWHAEQPQPAARSARWDGYRYLGLGVVVPPDYHWPAGSPWRAVFSPDGQVREQMLMLAQYAAAEGCAAYAVVTWDPARCRLVYNIRTLDRPVTAHESRLAQKAQKLIGELSLRGRPIESPIRARERLLRGARELDREHWAISREGLARVIPGVHTVDAVADLLERAMWELPDLAGEFRRLSDPRNKTHTSRGLGV